MINASDIDEILNGAIGGAILKNKVLQVGAFSSSSGGTDSGGTGTLIVSAPEDLLSTMTKATSNALISFDPNSSGAQEELANAVAYLALASYMRTTKLTTALREEFNSRNSDDTTDIGADYGIDDYSFEFAVCDGLRFKGMSAYGIMGESINTLITGSSVNDVDTFKEAILTLASLLAETGIVYTRGFVNEVVKVGGSSPTIALFDGNVDTAVKGLVNNIENDWVGDTIQRATLDNAGPFPIDRYISDDDAKDAIAILLNILRHVVSEIDLTEVGYSKSSATSYVEELVTTYLDNYGHPTDADELNTNLKNSFALFNNEVPDVSELVNSLISLYGKEVVKSAIGSVPATFNGYMDSTFEVTSLGYQSAYSLVFYSYRVFARQYAIEVLNTASNSSELVLQEVEDECFASLNAGMYNLNSQDAFSSMVFNGGYPDEFIYTVSTLCTAYDSTTTCVGKPDTLEEFGDFGRVLANDEYQPLSDVLTDFNQLLVTGTTDSVYDAGTTAGAKVVDDNGGAYPTDGSAEPDSSGINIGTIINYGLQAYDKLVEMVAMNREHIS